VVASLKGEGMGEVTIIIPTYFGGQLIGNCVSSILKNVPDARFLVYKNDIGWLQAANTIMKSLNTDVILLNDDTLVISDIVGSMKEKAYSDEKIGIVGGKSLEPNTETIINYGIYVAPDGNTAHRYFGQPRNSVKAEKQKAVEGSCMFIKRALIDEIGLFDEKYGMGYREEVDYCFTAREAGWKVVSTPDAEYVHFTSQTNSRLGIKNDTHEYFMSKWGTKLKLGVV
jgi:GT2 family glycosyltransferase